MRGVGLGVRGQGPAKEQKEEGKQNVTHGAGEAQAENKQEKGGPA
jgi:hypothetical protein